MIPRPNRNGSVIRLQYATDNLFIYVDDVNSVTARAIVAYFRSFEFFVTDTRCPSIPAWRARNRGQTLRLSIPSCVLRQGYRLIQESIQITRREYQPIPDINFVHQSGEIPNCMRPFMRPLLQAMIFSMEAAASNGECDFLNPVTNTRTRRFQAKIFRSILNVYKVSLDLLEDDKNEMLIREYFYMFKRCDGEERGPTSMYLTQNESNRHIICAADLLQRPRVAMGFTTNILSYFYGDIEIEWTNNDGTIQRIDAGNTSTHDRGFPVSDIFVRSAFGMIPPIRVQQYGRANKTLLLFEGAGTYKRFEKHYKDKGLIIVWISGHADASAKAMICNLTKLLQCRTGYFGDMDLGGLRIINGFNETAEITETTIDRSISRAELIMFRLDILRFGITMEQIEDFFGYENVAINIMSANEKAGLIKFREESDYCRQTDERLNSGIDVERRIKDLDLQILKGISTKPEKVPADLFDMFVNCFLRNPM